ncbi:Concanavalin A-like lectin/glucanase domain containing protein [Rhypophila sp. PSN 637]
MLPSLIPLGLVALLGATVAVAQECTLDKKCPEDKPCCSQYNQCGTGAFCLGGCDPRMSFSIDSCVPSPVCKDANLKMDTLDRYRHISEFLGDPDEADWVGQGDPVIFKGTTLLTMPKGSVGTVLASTRHMWYGNVKAKVKTSKGAGVVTAFILFGDVKDEIDFEWVGTDLSTVQTNFYFQGIPNYANSENITKLSNTYDNWHEYEIRWTPEKIEWLVDGVSGRTVLKSDTFNKTSNQFEFPQTPTRVQLSIWPGGLASNAQGTIDWAGGPIDWDSDEIKKYGYYFASFKDVSIECYKTNSPPGTNKGISYWYNDIRATNDTVVDGKKPTILKSFEGTGTDMDKGAPSGTGNGGAHASNVPGGIVNNPGNQVPGGVVNQPGPGNGGGSGSGTGSGSAPPCKATGFSQTCPDETGATNNQNNGVRGAERTLGASAFAVVIGFAGLLFL